MQRAFKSEHSDKLQINKAMLDIEKFDLYCQFHNLKFI